MYLKPTYYISLDGVAKDYSFLESHVVMLFATGQYLTTCITRRLNHLVFVLFIQMSIPLFLKLLIKVIFQFHWILYRGFESFMPKHAHKDSKIWSACVALIYFPVVVWQETNKVML